DALVTAGALAHPAGELLAGAAGPRAVRGRLEVLLEVVGGARLVRAEDHADRLVRELDALVLGGDRGVVPGGDGAVEDVGEGLARERDIDAVEVVRHGDRAEHGREGPRGALRSAEHTSDSSHVS